MIKKICLENFMAHQATCFELSPGVTVITGPNNIGKSAVVEAIRYLVYNPAPKNVIRHGAKKAVVRLALDSGEKISWERQDKHAAYVIEQPGQEPQEYHKFGRDVPEDVRSLLRLELVKTDTEEKIDIHLGNQRQPIFLLDRPGSHAAGFFAASTEADYLLKMQQALKRRMEQANRDRKRLDTELAELTVNLGHYAPLDDLEVLLLQAEADYAVIMGDQRRLPRLAELIQQVTGLRSQLAGETQAATALRDLTPPPPLEDLSGLAFLTTELEDQTRLLHREAARTASLAELAAPPALTATIALETWLSDYREVLRRQTLTGQHQQALSHLAAPPACLETSDLAVLLRALHRHTALLEAGRQRTALLAQTPAPPNLAGVAGLPELIAELARQVAKTRVLARHNSVLAPLAAPPALHDLGPLGELVAVLARETNSRSGWQRQTRYLARLQPPPASADLSGLEALVHSLTEGETTLAHLHEQQDGCRQALDQKRAEIQEYLRAVDLCPLCGSPLNLEHFLEGHHD